MLLEKDDVVRLVTGSGGDYRDPRRCPKEKVAEDLRNGYVTRGKRRIATSTERTEGPSRRLPRQLFSACWLKPSPGQAAALHSSCPSCNGMLAQPLVQRKALL